LYRTLERRLIQQMRDFLRRTYDLDLAKIVVEQPPKVELGEYAMPLAFELAKKLRKAPRKIAEEIVNGIGPIEGFEELEVAGAGYINARVKRGEVAAALLADENPKDDVPAGKILVEHSSINPNKAAHIGHLRNAILGDTFVRLLRFAGREVDVQNYIDNTGVQVADVVVGFLYIEKKSRAEIEQLASQPRFDYYCWDLYARASQWYEQDKQNLQTRLKTLHEIEEGGNETAAIADLISVAVLRRHLETMDRLDIEYDFLPRESEILHLHFWDAAFTKLKEGGVLFYETEGKNKGCWVMRRAGTGKKSESAENAEKAAQDAEKAKDIRIRPEDLRVDTYVAGSHGVRITHIPTGIAVASDSENSQQENRKRAIDLLRVQLHARGKDDSDEYDVLRAIEPLESVDLRKSADDVAEEDQKVIVRSNGTVGYVGKDIAYHMWKFGLLGRDFEYRKFYKYPNQHQVWISATEGEPNHPHFGDVAEIYNVIDARQAEAQSTVIEALRGLGHNEAADHYTHFSYEMVALTPRCAGELGYQLSEEDKARSYIEVSGRKGFGVKADDLLDRLIASAKAEVDPRQPQSSDDERREIATQIAIGALRYFMLKFTKPSVIAFDFKEALSFEGETGPYAQYAVVRATNIFRKGGFDPEVFTKDAANRPSAEDFTKYLNGDAGNEIWKLWLAAAKTAYVVEQCIATTEPAYLAKHAFQLAQLFNYFYHRHPILNEADEGRKRFLLATVAVVRRELIRTLAVLGITVPPVM
jgi:arginyl-tRNA synthetase